VSASTREVSSTLFTASASAVRKLRCCSVVHAHKGCCSLERVPYECGHSNLYFGPNKNSKTGVSGRRGLLNVSLCSVLYSEGAGRLLRLPETGSSVGHAQGGLILRRI